MADEEEGEEGGDEAPPPPPVKQKLFMLEFIIDDVSLDFCNAQQLICYGEGKTVIEFKFLDIGPLRITEDEFPTQWRYLEGCTGTGIIKNGKSLLFGLTPEQAEEVAGQALIYCDIFKKTAAKEYHLGGCIVRIINLFRALLAAIKESELTTHYKNVKDFYKIKNSDGEVVGHMYAYIRMSCFNELVVNKFNKDPNAQLDFTVDPTFYKYKYNRASGEKKSIKQVCECNAAAGAKKKASTSECVCPEEEPHKTCPQIYTDNKCIYNCPQTIRPCAECPPSCKANKAAGRIRTRAGVMPGSASKAGGKKGKGGKAKGKGKGKKK